MSRCRHLLRVAVGLLGLTATTGCGEGGDRPARFETNAPERVDDIEYIDAQPFSVIHAPVRVAVEPLLAQMESHVPSEWVEEGVEFDSGGVVASMAFSRTPFEMSVHGDTAVLSATVAYALRATYDVPMLPDINAACGTDPDEPAPRLVVTLRAPVVVTEDWRLSPATEVHEVRAASERDLDRCEVTLLGIDITERVVEGTRTFLRDHTGVLDSLAREVDVRSHFEEWWGTIARPVSLDDGVWLEMRPAAISRGVVRGTGPAMEIDVTLQARPRVVFGERPRSSPTALPALGFAEPRPSRLNLHADLVVEYPEAGSSLSEEFAGVELSAGGRRISIESLRPFGIGGGEVAVEVGISGDAVGSVFLVGTPMYENNSREVSVPDLSIDVSTSSVLVTAASWVLDIGMEAMLRERARLSVDSGVEWVTAWAELGLNSALAEGVSLGGTVHSVEVVDVVALADGLLVRFALDVEAELNVTEGAGRQ